MTPIQEENRAERVAIMTADGEITEGQAHEYCDTRPEVYGLRSKEYKQPVLMV